MTEAACPSRKPRFFYGYVIVIVAFLVMAITPGTLYSYGVFVKPLMEEFGWSRAVTAGAYSAAVFILGIFFTITGRLNDRFGPRRVLTVCGLILAIGYFLTSRVEAAWQLYLFFGVIVGIGHSGSFIPMMSTVARWFTKRRGLMGGIVVAGIGVGQVVLAPLTARLIAQYGWRSAFLALSIISLVLVAALAQFLKRDPGTVGQFVDGAKEAETSSLALESGGFSREAGLRTRQFWMAFAIYVCYGFLAQGTMVHLVPHATDLGVSAVAAASLLSVIGAVSIAGKITTGTICDRTGIRRTLIAVFILGIAALVWLQFAGELWSLYAFAVLFALSYGGLITLQSPLVAELFGLRAHGALLGGVQLGSTIGGAASPLIAGRIFDVTGSYRLAFTLITGLLIIGLVLATALRPQAKYPGESLRTHS